MIKKNIKQFNKVLVFGGSGFLGSHICDQLTDQNYDVTIFDKNKSKYLKKKQKIVIGDISNIKQVKNASKNKDYILHFAAVSDIEESNLDPIKTIKYNIVGTANILEVMRKNKKIKKIIYASSIYARSKEGGFYSTSKRSSESLIENYNEKFNINYSILRFGSLYGIRANFFNPINNFIKQAIRFKKIERIGDGSDVRNYINVKDAAKICIKILELNENNKHYNILGNKRMTVKSLIKLIAKKTNIKKIIFKKTKKKELLHYKVNPFSYKVYDGIFFNNKNEIKLDDGIEEMINFLKKK